MLIASLKKIDEGYDYKVISNIFELKMLDFLGIRPVIDECVNNIETITNLNNNQYSDIL